MRRVCILILILALHLSLAEAQELTVGLKPAAPFVIDEDGVYSGFSLDLMDELAERNGDTITYVMYPDVPSHINAVEDADVDIGIAATTITSEREERVDFGHPFFDGSLGIITERDVKKSMSDIIFSPHVLLGAGGVIVYLLLCALIIWLIERGKNLPVPFGKGIATGIWWVIVTMSTVGYGDVYPKSSRGRVFGSIVIISGIAIFSIILAGLSSAFALNQVQAAISGPEDLIGEPVAVISGTAAMDSAEDYGMRAVPITSLDEGRRLVIDGDAVALMHDLPLLRYSLKTAPEPRLALLDKTLEPASYGMLFPQGSELRGVYDVHLLAAIEDGTVDTLQKKWFG